LNQSDRTSSTRPRILVVGAGPAGAAAAMRIHAQALDVLWVDRATFPRSKVCGCCLNRSALAALSKIGSDHIITDLAGQELRWWRLESMGRTVEAELPGGVAISRYRMDVALIDEARRRGIEIRTGCEAKIVAVSNRSVRVRLTSQTGDTDEHDFDVVVLATGLSGGGVSRWLPWTSEPAGPLGVGTTVDDLDGVRDRTIHMASDSGGYVGLVRLEDGRVDVAAALRREDTRDAHGGRADPGGGKAVLLDRMNAILRRSGFGQLPPGHADSLMTTPPLHRARKVGFGRLLAIGDAAGYVEPFTGEGMAWAIQTGVAVADTIADHRAAIGTGDGLDVAWSDRYAKMMRSRQWLCRFLSRSLASPRQSRWLVRGMTLAPWAVRRAIVRLNRG
jgi:menaquinone-9 beta-reductase